MMRAAILLLLWWLGGLRTSALAQGGFPFPDSAALWVQTYAFMVGQPPLPEFEVMAVANIQVDGTDTLIGGTSYSQLTDRLTGAYYGAIRDDEGRVWHVPPDSVNSYVLYDFTVSAGDTVRDVIYYQGFPSTGAGPSLTDLVVQDVVLDPLWGGRRVVYVGAWPWIEGIGQSAGLLAEPFINISNYQLRLECMSYMDTVRYEHFAMGEQATPGACQTISLGYNTLEVRGEERFYPNPSTGLFQVPPGSTAPFLVLDAHGKEVLRAPAGVRSMDLSAHPPGVYTVVQHRPEGTRAQRLLVLR